MFTNGDYQKRMELERLQILRFFNHSYLLPVGFGRYSFLHPLKIRKCRENPILVVNPRTHEAVIVEEFERVNKASLI
jgi:hypothetical protein